MNRAERRAKESAFKKQIKDVIKTGDWGRWEDKSIDFREKKKNAHAFYANYIYSVQVYNDDGQIVAGIRRHDQSVNVPWADKQRIKNEIFGEEKLFIECFPPEKELIDQANLFWIWEMVSDKNCFDLKKALSK